MNKKLENGNAINRRHILMMTGAGVAALGAGLRRHALGNGSGHVQRSRQLLHQRQGDRAEGHLQEPVPDERRGNLFIPKDLDRNAQESGDRRRPSDGRGEGAKRQSLCHEDGRAGFRHVVARFAVLGRERGQPRNLVSPDVYAEDFSAAVDFLGTRPFVDRDRIGAIGICGSGSFVISAAKIDPRMKAIATVSMYDMGAANRNGLKHSLTLEQRKKIIAAAAEQRYVGVHGRRDQVHRRDGA